MTAEHVQLYTLTAQLDQADETPRSVAELRELIDQLLRVLEHHLIHEQALLAALPEAPDRVPAAADLVACVQTCLPPTDEPVLILLDALPEPRAVQICLERLLRLRPGPSAEIHSSHDTDLQQVCRWIHGFDSTRYGIARLPTSLTRSALQVPPTRHLTVTSSRPVIEESRMSIARGTAQTTWEGPLATAQIAGIDGEGFQAAGDEATALFPISRLFAGPRISVQALLESN